MTSPTAREMLNNALKRLEELRLESEALDNLVSTYRSILKGDNPNSETQEEQPDLYRGLSQRMIQSARIAEMIESARRVVISEGRPMKRGELVKRLQAQGFDIIGTDKNKVFGTNLWRSGKFVAIEGKGYWPKDVSLPSESLNRKL